MTPLLLMAGGALGFSLGLLGAGGSILAVPALMVLGGLSPRQAMASGLLTVGTTAVLGALLDVRGMATAQIRERLRMAMSLAVPGFGGAAAGARIAPLIPESALLIGFLTLMLAAAFRLLKPSRYQSAGKDVEAAVGPRSVLVMALVGLGLGMLTGIFGIGGGFLVVPAMVGLFHLPVASAASMSLWVIAVNAFAGLVGRAADGDIVWNAASLLTLGAIIGLMPGLACKLRLPEVVLRRSFAVILLLIGLVLGWQQFARG
jgi:hypothetical protein